MIGHSRGNFAKDVTGSSLTGCRCIVTMPYLYIEDEFQESETIQSITGLDSSVTAANISNGN